ncbi:phosphoribosylamine--glycine ligase [Candidatus Bathyarchaeota archaeon]|nr:MAG: phosphoribosylamine--glycine ligase [Candidatus Bathyarchaeota archaeon]
MVRKTVKVLLVGEAAREHAIAEAICRSRLDPKLYAAMKLNNPGIASLCKITGGEVILGDYQNPEFVVETAKKHHVDFVFVGPEEPLFRGVSDELEKEGIPCIGAKRKPAELEMSKAFMRRLMWKHRIPGRLRFMAFSNVEDAIAYIKEYAESVALKPARQAGGKGVKVIADLQAYLTSEKTHVKEEHAKAIDEKYMKDYTDIEDRILIEERVEGPEYTLQTFTDGRTVKPLPLVQDNKNAFEMDIGPETGGMGSIAGKGMLLPFVTEEEYRRSVEIVKSCVRAVEKETGEKYKGIVSGQMMCTVSWGPTIIEFYSRLGDPEAVNVLPILETDLIEICEAIIEERLNKIKMKFKEVATVVKCIAPKGYPEERNLAKGHPVHINEETIKKRGCKVYYASTNLQPNGKIISGGSRLVEIFGTGKTIPEAGRKVEECIPYVWLEDGWGVFHRSDIGSEQLLEKRIEQANLIRAVYKYRAKKGLIGKTVEWIPKKGKIILET